MRKIKRKSEYHVYIVRCRQGMLYTGYTSDLKVRIERHNRGHGAKYLKGKGPVKLVWSKAYRYWKCAVREEARIKRLSRARKLQLIAGVRPHERGSGKA